MILMQDLVIYPFLFLGIFPDCFEIIKDETLRSKVCEMAKHAQHLYLISKTKSNKDLFYFKNLFYFIHIWDSSDIPTLNEYKCFLTLLMTI